MSGGPRSALHRAAHLVLRRRVGVARELGELLRAQAWWDLAGHQDPHGANRHVLHRRLGSLSRRDDGIAGAVGIDLVLLVLLDVFVKVFTIEIVFDVFIEIVVVVVGIGQLFNLLLDQGGERLAQRGDHVRSGVTGLDAPGGGSQGHHQGLLIVAEPLEATRGRANVRLALRRRGQWQSPRGSRERALSRGLPRRLRRRRRLRGRRTEARSQDVQNGPMIRRPVHRLHRLPASHDLIGAELAVRGDTNRLHRPARRGAGQVQVLGGCDRASADHADAFTQRTTRGIHHDAATTVARVRHPKEKKNPGIPRTRSERRLIQELDCIRQTCLPTARSTCEDRLCVESLKRKKGDDKWRRQSLSIKRWAALSISLAISMFSRIPLIASTDLPESFRRPVLGSS